MPPLHFAARTYLELNGFFFSGYGKKKASHLGQFFRIAEKAQFQIKASKIHVAMF